ncbi:hypothetical protein [Halobacterium salinarum]|uniref:hypothetical protein n=1 Tax=Halobacterium salinarum TaxID=2242 RepID=UPI002557042B|nr:hypothetical protein [Halobacterium salinarum]MDL0126310.1 hypothetical protein [Halobacterium salinarum]MDL0145718.1 hypothetical protein [Halobacterium salinarum]
MSLPTDRPRGAITKADRKLLLGLTEYDTKQQYSNRRADIRNRITNALLDFSLIQYSLQDKDRKRIFQNPANEAGVEEAQFQESIQSMLYWIYLGLKEQQYDFEGLLMKAIGEAEEDYARKYLGEAVDISVNFNVDVTRSHDIDALISQIESGGPVQSNRLYDLLQLSEGVPIDLGDLSTLRVWFKSAYPDGEKEVLETLFSEYLGTDIEIVDAEARVDLSELGIEKDDAVIDSASSPTDPSEIKHNPSPLGSSSEETIEEIKQEEMKRRTREGRRDKTDSSSSILAEAIDSTFEDSDEGPQSIYTVIKTELMQGRDVTPESVTELLEDIREELVSTEDVAAAFGCNPNIARRALSEISGLEKQSVLDTQQSRLEIWTWD